MWKQIVADLSQTPGLGTSVAPYCHVRRRTPWPGRGNAVRREEQVAPVGCQLAIEVQGEGRVAGNERLDLSGSGHWRRHKHQAQENAQDALDRSSSLAGEG